MKHQLNLRAATLYGQLLSFVEDDDVEEFAQVFENFLDVYDKPKPTPKLPEIGKYYRTEGGTILRVLDILDDGDNCFVTLKTFQKSLNGKPRESVIHMLPSEFQYLKLKECSEWQD